MEQEDQTNKISSEIVCTFKTNLAEKYKIDEDQLYTIKTNFNDKNLAELIKTVLVEEDPDMEEELNGNLKFEFLINGEFLRGNIKSHLIKHSISAEQTVVINYTFGISKPQEGQKKEEEDWISNIQILNLLNKNKKSGFVASLFNGDLSFYDQNMNQLFRQNIAEDIIINQTKATPHKNGSDFILISACQDDLIRVGGYNPKEQKYYEITECIGNENSVNCVDVNPLYPYQFCSGSFDGRLNIYNLNEKDLQSVGSSTTKENERKKVKLDKKNTMYAQSKPELHKDSITRVQFKSQHEVLSSSLDHSVKLYDIQKNNIISDITTKDSAVTTFAQKGDLVLTGHEDSYIKTYDVRENQKQKNHIYKSHTLWVSDIQFLDNSEYIFVSGSYDHSLKLWDIRSSLPIATMKTHHDKIFSVQWNGDSQILSGGSDKIIASHDFVQPQI